MPFLDSDTYAKEGVIYFYQGFFPLYDAIHEWMTGRMNGWMEKASRKTTTTSFTICNSSLKDFGPLVTIGLFFIQGFLKDDILACVET
jgi:hypothetical protein